MEDLSFEEALKGLEDIVVKLEEGGTTLDESLRLYEQGSRLAQICQTKLSKAEERLKELVQAADGLELREASLGED